MMNIKQKRIITAWLMSGIFLIALMIVIGGVTRITESGLSMVNWSIPGELPTEKNIEKSYIEWQKSPQGKHLNSLDFEEFKTIYFWEYIHRMTGRIIGLIFIIPFIFFVIKRWIKKEDLKKYFFILILGSIQAGLGWYMVQSGLVDKPQVSHLRLALHLMIALILSAYIWWMVLDLNCRATGNKMINKLSYLFLILLSIQLTYGAFTAGLRAGYYTDPQNYLNTIFGYFNTQGMRNLDFLNNPYNVQFLHRILAWILSIFALYIWSKTRKTELQKAGNLFLFIVILQITLGILTLVTGIQKHLAITHQFVASILMFIVIYLIHQSQPNEKI